MSVRTRGVASGAALALVAALALAGCGSGASYVANDTHEIYLKLPAEWTAVGPEDDAADEAEGDSAEPATTEEVDPDALPWRAIFDRDDHPSVEHFQAAVPTQPVGLIAAVEPSAETRDSLTLAGLRSLAVGGDPLDLASEGTMSLKMLGNIDDYDVNGNHGNRVRFSFIPEVGGPQVVMEQVAVTDPGRNRIYVIQVKCEAECFERHLDEIEEIIGSFHIGDE